MIALIEMHQKFAYISTNSRPELTLSVQRRERCGCIGGLSPLLLMHPRYVVPYSSLRHYISLSVYFIAHSLVD